MVFLLSITEKREWDLNGLSSIDEARKEQTLTTSRSARRWLSLSLSKLFFLAFH